MQFFNVLKIITHVSAVVFLFGNFPGEVAVENRPAPDNESKELPDEGGKWDPPPEPDTPIAEEVKETLCSAKAKSLKADTAFLVVG